MKVHGNKGKKRVYEKWSQPPIKKEKSYMDYLKEAMKREKVYYSWYNSRNVKI